MSLQFRTVPLFEGALSMKMPNTFLDARYVILCMAAGVIRRTTAPLPVQLACTVEGELTYKKPTLHTKLETI